MDEIQKEFVGQAGWSIVCSLTMFEEYTEMEFFSTRLETIEKIFTLKNIVLNTRSTWPCVPSGWRSSITKKSLAVAIRIGKVEVDHGQTSCKTLDAAA